MIELRDVHKRFGANEVLKGITASVEKSEVVCIIGPSGSGKSTILRCINGLESYEAGDIFVEGARVDNHAPSIVGVRTQVSMVFQRFNLFPHRTALENVIEGPIYVKKEPRAQSRPAAAGRRRADAADDGCAWTGRRLRAGCGRDRAHQCAVRSSHRSALRRRFRAPSGAETD